MDSAELLQSPLLLGRGFRHAFFARGGGASTGAYTSLNFSIAVGDSPEAVGENLSRAAVALGVPPEKLYYLSQVHGKAAITLLGNEDRRAVVECQGDALLSRSGGCAVAVRTADCVPVLVGDSGGGGALAIHAGWRGLVAGVVESGVLELVKVSGPTSGFVAAIGPHIGVQSFEVSADVAEQLRACSPDPNVVDRSRGPKPHVDLAKIVVAKLRALGIPLPNVERVGGCTFAEPERYFSFRRDGARSGRHLAAIVPRPSTTSTDGR